MTALIGVTVGMMIVTVPFMMGVVAGLVYVGFTLLSAIAPIKADEWGAAFALAWIVGMMSFIAVVVMWASEKPFPIGGGA